MGLLASIESHNTWLRLQSWQMVAKGRDLTMWLVLCFPSIKGKIMKFSFLHLSDFLGTTKLAKLCKCFTYLYRHCYKRIYFSIMFIYHTLITLLICLYIIPAYLTVSSSISSSTSTGGQTLFCSLPCPWHMVGVS